MRNREQWVRVAAELTGHRPTEQEVRMIAGQEVGLLAMLWYAVTHPRLMVRSVRYGWEHYRELTEEEER